MILSPPMVVAAGLAGACVGSFVATAVQRALNGRPFLAGRSCCDGCGRRLGLAATAPLVSYAVFRGVCIRCRTPIDPIHPVGEAAGLAIGLAAPLLSRTAAEAGLAAVLGFVLLGAALMDARSQRLPDRLTLAAAALALALSALAGRDALVWGLAAAVTAFAVLELLRRGFEALRKAPGLGQGDVKLVAALALWLGAATPWAIVLAAIGGLAGFAFIRPRRERMAFGPVLALAGYAVGLLCQAGLWPELAGGRS